MDPMEKYFDTAFAAPDGISRLRKLILTLAMQGKLVPQDPNDPPASDLLGEIEAEKLQLIKEKKIKASNPLPSIKPEEVPYELPNGWEWVRFIEIGNWAVGSGFPLGIQGDQKQEIFLCKVSDMNSPGNEKYIESVNNTISQELAHKYKINIHESGTIIFPKIGGAIATNKRRILTRRTAIDNNCLGIKPYKQINLEWVYQLLLSIDLSNYQVGTSVPAISQGVIGEIVIGLPPSPEQHRIVAKIDQLMAGLNEIAKLRVKREQQRLAAHRSALNHLLTATESDDFRDACRFTNQHFGELYSVKETVTELRKAILQFAIMGKLVPQDPNDPPASDLLGEIEAEKLQLIKEKKIKASNPLPSIKPGEVPYELPNGWEWVRFFTVNAVKSKLVSATDHPMEKQIAPDSIEKGTGRLLFHRTVEESGAIGPSNRFYKGQILYSKIRPSLNKVVIAPYDGLCSADMYPIETRVCAEFMMRVILSQTFLDQVRIAENRVKMPKLNLNSLGSFVIPVPPLNEQRRIVAKVDQLMTLCDTLEEEIVTANDKQAAMLSAVMSGM